MMWMRGGETKIHGRVDCSVFLVLVGLGWWEGRGRRAFLRSGGGRRGRDKRIYLNEAGTLEVGLVC